MILRAPFLLLILGVFLAACSRAHTGEISYRAVEDGEIWFKNSAIQLRFDNEMYCRVFLVKGGKALSMNDIPIDPAIAKPTHFIEVDGKEVKDFRVDYRNVGASDIRTPLGTGKRLHLTGYANTEQRLTVEKSLSVDFYQELPDLAIFSVDYCNTDKNRSLSITKVVSNFFRLDAGRQHPGSPRYAFWCFQGLASEKANENPARLTPNFSQALSTRSAGVGPAERFPFIDLWTEEMGMAIGEIQTQSGALTLPLQVAPDRRVEISVQDHQTKTMGPNESLPVSKGFLMVHPGDYRLPWQRFREIGKVLGPVTQP